MLKNDDVRLQRFAIEKFLHYHLCKDGNYFNQIYNCKILNMAYKFFKDRDGLITHLPEVTDNHKEALEILKKYRNNEIGAGNEVTIIENNSFISIDGITKTRTYYQMIGS